MVGLKVAETKVSKNNRFHGQESLVALASGCMLAELVCGMAKPGSRGRQR